MFLCDVVWNRSKAVKTLVIYFIGYHPILFHEGWWQKKPAAWFILNQVQTCRLPGRTCPSWVFLSGLGLEIWPAKMVIYPTDSWFHQHSWAANWQQQGTEQGENIWEWIPMAAGWTSLFVGGTDSFVHHAFLWRDDCQCGSGSTMTSEPSIRDLLLRSQSVAHLGESVW